MSPKRKPRSGLRRGNPSWLGRWTRALQRGPRCHVCAPECRTILPPWMRITFAARMQSSLPGRLHAGAVIRIRPLVEEDLPVLRAWMQEAPGAPPGVMTISRLWSKRLPPASEGSARAGSQSRAVPAMAGFAVATGLCIPGIPAECELEFVLVSSDRAAAGNRRHAGSNRSAWARDLRADEIRLEVRESNAGAVQLYERCGFTITGHRPDTMPIRRRMRC